MKSQLRLRIEHCVELGIGHQPHRMVKIDLEPDVVYHIGRFASDRLPDKHYDNNQVAHVNLNLPSEQRFYSKRAFSLIHPAGGETIRLSITNASGLRVSGRGIGNQTYAKNQIVHLPVRDDLVFKVVGQPPASVQIKLEVEGLSDYVPKPRDLDSTWVGMNLGDFLYWSKAAAQPNRQRQSLLEVLIYLSTLIQSQWCTKGHDFPSSKKLAELADRWLAKIHPESPKISAKQMTEAGRTATELYEVSVSPSSAWVSISQMLMSLGAMPPQESEVMIKELHDRGIYLEYLII